MAFEAVIGVEVHAQLLTETKMFCGCRTSFGAEPNTLTCPVCLGLPGALPVTNKRAVEFGIRLGLALGAEVRPRSVFARQHYFYPDLPKGYQISQYEEPLCERGLVTLGGGDGAEPRSVRIRRVHLEEDAGKLVHDEAYVSGDESLVDLNRCGTPLAEIVTEPDLRSPEETHAFLAGLRRLVRWIGVCDGNMEQGSLRCDANVSLRPAGAAALGVKTEIKNMNSFKGVERALAFEIARQTRLLESGGRVIQETLLWDESRGEALPMRGKEEAHDYRYFPDPDLAPVLVSADWIRSVRESMPELPEARIARWRASHGLSAKEAELLAGDRGTADYFEDLCRRCGDPKRSARWVAGEVMRALHSLKTGIGGLKAGPAHSAAILSLIDRGELSLSAAKKVFEAAAETGEEPAEAMARLGLSQVSDTGAIEDAARSAVSGHPDRLAAYLGGNEKLFGFFMGEVMKITQGKANPQAANGILRRLLDEARAPSAGGGGKNT